MGKQVNFEPDSAFRKEKETARTEEREKSEKPSAKTQKNRRRDESQARGKEEDRRVIDLPFTPKSAGRRMG
ncbi:hypothetical protein LNP74_15790 [Klebsiella pneumoniae subsp. pneumoniae]|nr:hypothetical protein [Klebsiella pneumoniae subsp. pneumoniae]